MDKPGFTISVSRINDDDTEPDAATPEERLDLLERLRLEAGKFIYEYPARFRRVVEVARKT
jgi:DNA repair photolyase